MARIVIVGSIAEDEVVHVGAPLRPGAHVEGRGLISRLGGGGPNTALPLAAAGHHVVLVSAMGCDAVGARLLRELVAGGVDTSAVVAVAEQPTTRSVVMIDDTGDRTIVNLGRTVEAEPPSRLLDLAADWLYVRSRDTRLASLLTQKAGTCRVLAHIPPCAAGGRPAHVLVGSESDLGPDVLADPYAAGRRIAGDGLEWMVVTHGARGATAFGPARRIEQAARAVAAIDTTGAGDSFAAGLLHGLTAGLAMDEALAVAVAWGTEKVLHEGSHLPASAVARLVAG